MADNSSHDIPDLDLPPQRTPRQSASLAPIASGAAPAAAAPSESDFGMELDRGQAMAAPTSSSRLGARSSVRQVAIDVRGSDDELDMEIERGGAMTAQAPASSSRMSGHMATRPSGSMAAVRPAQGSGLDVSYRRMDAERQRTAQGPSTGAKIAAYTLPFVLFAGTAAALVKVVHRHGGRNVMALVPHAFDATSTVESGSFALSALVLAIAFGFIGLRLHPRSYGMVGSAVLLVLASLAMVTVTLVSLEEQPSPPDGALLIPYVVPLAVVSLGFGIAGRGPSLFLRGGSRRGASLLAGIGGGALVFLAIEISALARLLP